MKKKISIFTDASFDKQSSLSVLGYAYLYSESDTLDEAAVKLVEEKSNNNIRAEIKSALKALENCPPCEEITLYTDCANICGLTGRREKLERTNYISKSKGTELKNADLYREFYKIYDELKPNIIWVKGHTAKDQQSDINKNFSVLDKAVRGKLRFILKNHYLLL